MVKAVDGEGLVVFLMKECQGKPDISHKDNAKDARNSSPTDARELMKHVLTKEAAIIACNFDDLRPAGVLFRYAFELTNNTPVCPLHAEFRSYTMKF